MCVYTYMIMFISLYLYIFIDIYISLLIFTSSIYTNIYIYTYIHTYIYIYILSPSLFSKISCCSLRFFLNSTGTAPSTSLAFWFASAVDWKATAAESHGPGRFDPQKRTHLNQPTPRKFQENIRLLLVSLEGFFHHGKLHPWDLSGSCKGCYVVCSQPIGRKNTAFIETGGSIDSPSWRGEQTPNH